MFAPTERPKAGLSFAQAAGALALGGEEVAVGEAEQGLIAVTIGGEHRETGRGGDRSGRIGSEAAPSDPGPQPRRHFLGLFGVGLGDDHGELVATLAEDRVLGPDLIAQGHADLGQQPVALEVAEALVDRLEAVEVEQDQGELARVAPVAADFLGQALVQAAVVADPGQLVTASQYPERLMAGPQAPGQQNDAGRDHGQAGRLDDGEDQGLPPGERAQRDREQQASDDRDQPRDEKAGPDRAATVRLG